MARIYGTIGSLKSLKYELEGKGIYRFNSVRQIQEFLSNYNSEKRAVLIYASNELDKEYIEASIALEENTQKKAELIKVEAERIDNKISALQSQIDLMQRNIDGNIFKKMLYSFQLYTLNKKSKYLVKNRTKRINATAKEITKCIENDYLFITNYKTDKQNLLEKRTRLQIEELEYTYKVVNNLNNLISGAIGENLVVKEIEKLSDDYVLLNDFSLNFPKPIFNKKKNERIYSIQIDHLLVSKSGIFIIETKNWSKASVNSLSLRSPVEQIRRSSFALFVYMSEEISLNGHHWGELQIPIRNIIVMINNKPKGKFKYVKVKLLEELNSYIKYFDPILTEHQTNRIIDRLTN